VRNRRAVPPGLILCARERNSILEQKNRCSARFVEDGEAGRKVHIATSRPPVRADGSIGKEVGEDVADRGLTLAVACAAAFLEAARPSGSSRSSSSGLSPGPLNSITFQSFRLLNTP
jgi:hypothetical protein